MPGGKPQKSAPQTLDGVTHAPVGGSWLEEQEHPRGGGRELVDRLPRTPPPRTIQSSGRSAAWPQLGEQGQPLTLHGLDLVGDVEAAQRGQRTQEGGHVRGALEALG